MFFHRRTKLRELADAESQGKSFWTTTFDPEARAKIGFAITEASRSDANVASAVGDRSAYLLRMDEGWHVLPVGEGGTNDFLEFLAKAEDQFLPSLIEAVCVAGADTNKARDPFSRSAFPAFFVGQFVADVNAVLRQHRVSFELINGEMVPFQSRELHVDVVEPTLRLLGGGDLWEKAEAAYQDALRGLADGRSDDAIADAARALRETLLALGCEGNALGPLLASARKRRMLGPHNAVMTHALVRIIDWVNADRTVTRDAHVESRASRDDAWFSVHVIGALILRLTQGAGTKK
jgi:hypothetical protein